MNYKGFIIEPEIVDECRWSKQDELVEITGQQMVYKIKSLDSALIYGIKSTLTQAQRLIDKQGKAWQTSVGLQELTERQSDFKPNA